MMIACGIIGGLRTEVVFLAAASNSSSPLNNFTQNDQPFGDEDPSRQIIVLVYGNNSNLVQDSNYTTAVTVGGVSATRKVQPSGNQLRHFTAWITPRLDNSGPSGTSGTIQATRSTGNGYTTVGFAAFAAYNLKGSDPIDAYLTTSQNPAASTTLQVLGGGIITAFAQGDTTGAFDWTGADEVYDATGGVSGSQRFSAALVSRANASAAHLIEADSDDTSDGMIAVSWR